MCEMESQYNLVSVSEEAQVGPIEFTDSEQKLWDQVYFRNHPAPVSGKAIKASIEPAHELARSLIERKAIPQVRWRYFVDPKLNVRGTKSRKQIFEENGTRGDAILRHPHFHKYLRYFILGPDLPAETVAAFSSLLGTCAPVTSGDQQALCELAGREVRSRGLERKSAAEEFFKLALELGIDDDMSRAIRGYVMRMRGV